MTEMRVQRSRIRPPGPRLKTALDPPVDIPAGAIGSVTRVSDWDVWVCFDKGVIRLPKGEVEEV